LGILIIILVITDEIGNNVRLSNINQEAISDNDRALQLSERTISLTEISNLVESIHGIELNVKLSSLMIIASTHHWIHVWLILAFRIVWIVHGDDEIVHFLLKYLLASSVFNVASSCTCPIL
jgi:hypothetical protein